MEQAKIQLSAAEMSLVCNAELILTKNNILQKTKSLLEHLQARMQQEAFIHTALQETAPKISKGENYLGLPYLVLDYPRLFGHANIFAIRSFFWWGHFFSSTLQLSGSWCRQYAPALAAAYPQLVHHQYYVQVGNDPWAHHFSPDNYRPVAAFSAPAFEAYCTERVQIKIAARWPLEIWPDAANNLWESWRFLLGVCRA